jgi:hypothetical protein
MMWEKRIVSLREWPDPKVHAMCLEFGRTACGWKDAGFVWLLTDRDPVSCKACLRLIRLLASSEPELWLLQPVRKLLLENFS